ncbi:TetR/AcrR family transcriptional regulator [Caulobacter hibisci]|uniref:TetR/AcrR family transcriptional regulator n=1 Tax=Caulobacter hibisci TaxID=2035993 RepID=A0ABS0T423_9CAUL|nr:TetR/AcrR family transcriptional regulator [Caulobacter hibisci]MBI1686628.1 TetR/AcrR family transcriptional regulator [Caulobacter hibisci]
MLSEIAAAPKPRQSRRIATEAAIVEAFGRLMERGSVHDAGVNALIKEAGVGKKQIYDYFGGLGGVADAWVRRTGIWPRLTDMLDESLDAFHQRPAMERLRMLVRAYASTLRAHPAVATIMAGEFAGPPELRDAVTAVRIRIWEEYERLFIGQRSEDKELLAVAMTMLSAVSYIGMRAKFEPNFFGFDLQDDAAWDQVSGMLDHVMGRYQTGVEVAADRQANNAE